MNKKMKLIYTKTMGKATYDRHQVSFLPVRRDVVSSTRDQKKE